MESFGQDNREEEGQRDPFDGEYIGNIWGWRFSLLGLALILVMGGLMAYRHVALGVPFGADRPTEPLEMVSDSLEQSDTLPR